MTDKTSTMPDEIDIEETEEYVPHEQPWTDPGIPLVDGLDEDEERDIEENPDVPDEDRGL